MTRFSGDTESGMAPILGAKFWTRGTELSGVVLGSFSTANGPCTTIKLNKALEVSGDIISPPRDGNAKLDAISVGSMKGFEAAIRASGCGSLQAGDKVKIKCTGSQDTGQKSDMVLFSIDVDRDTAAKASSF